MGSTSAINDYLSKKVRQLTIRCYKHTAILFCFDSMPVYSNIKNYLFRHPLDNSFLNFCIFLQKSELYSCVNDALFFLKHLLGYASSEHVSFWPSSPTGLQVRILSSCICRMPFLLTYHFYYYCFCRAVFGVKGNVHSNVGCVDDGAIVYPAGNFLVKASLSSRHQEYAQWTHSSGPVGVITAMAISPSRRYVAVAETSINEADGCVITVFNSRSLRTRRVLTTNGQNPPTIHTTYTPNAKGIEVPSPLAFPCKNIVCLAISPDDSCLAIVGGAPDWYLAVYSIDKGRILAYMSLAVELSLQPSAVGKKEQDDRTAGRGLTKTGRGPVPTVSNISGSSTPNSRTSGGGGGSNTSLDDDTGTHKSDSTPSVLAPAAAVIAATSALRAASGPNSVVPAILDTLPSPYPTPSEHAVAAPKLNGKDGKPLPFAIKGVSFTSSSPERLAVWGTHGVVRFFVIKENPVPSILKKAAEAVVDDFLGSDFISPGDSTDNRESRDSKEPRSSPDSKQAKLPTKRSKDTAAATALSTISLLPTHVLSSLPLDSTFLHHLSFLTILLALQEQRLAAFEAEQVQQTKQAEVTTNGGIASETANRTAGNKGKGNPQTAQDLFSGLDSDSPSGRDNDTDQFPSHKPSTSSSARSNPRQNAEGGDGVDANANHSSGESASAADTDPGAHADLIGIHEPSDGNEENPDSDPVAVDGATGTSADPLEDSNSNESREHTASSGDMDEEREEGATSSTGASPAKDGDSRSKNVPMEERRTIRSHRLEPIVESFEDGRPDSALREEEMSSQSISVPQSLVIPNAFESGGEGAWNTLTSKGITPATLGLEMTPLEFDQMVDLASRALEKISYSALAALTFTSLVWLDVKEPPGDASSTTSRKGHSLKDPSGNSNDMVLTASGLLTQRSEPHPEFGTCAAATASGDILIFRHGLLLTSLPTAPRDGKPILSLAAFSRGFLAGGADGALRVFELVDPLLEDVALTDPESISHGHTPGSAGFAIGSADSSRALGSGYRRSARAHSSRSMAGRNTGKGGPGGDKSSQGGGSGLVTPMSRSKHTGSGALRNPSAGTPGHHHMRERHWIPYTPGIFHPSPTPLERFANFVCLKTVHVVLPALYCEPSINCMSISQSESIAVLSVAGTQFYILDLANVHIKEERESLFMPAGIYAHAPVSFAETADVSKVLSTLDAATDINADAASASVGSAKSEKPTEAAKIASSSASSVSASDSSREMLTQSGPLTPGQASVATSVMAEPQKPLDPFADKSYFGPESALTSCAITGMDVAVRKPLVVTTGLDCSVRVWNFVEKTCEVLKVFSDIPTGVAIHPSGFHIAVGFPDRLRIMNVLAEDYKDVKEYPLRNCTELKFSHNGHFLAAASGPVIQIFDFLTGAYVCALRGHSGRVTGLHWAYNDATLISVAVDGGILEWSIEEGKRTREHLSKGCQYLSIHPSKDGTTIYAVMAAQTTQAYQGRMNRDDMYGMQRLPGMGMASNSLLFPGSQGLGTHNKNAYERPSSANSIFSLSSFSTKRSLHQGSQHYENSGPHPLIRVRKISMNTGMVEAEWPCFYPLGPLVLSSPSIKDKSMVAFSGFSFNAPPATVSPQILATGVTSQGDVLPPMVPGQLTILPWPPKEAPGETLTTGDFELPASSTSVRKLHLSHDESFLFVAGWDGSITIYDVRDKDGRIPVTANTVKAPWGDEILVTLSDLEERKNSLQTLRASVAGMQGNVDYNARQSEALFQEELKRLGERYAQELSAMRQQRELIIEERIDIEREYAARLAATETAHKNELQKRESYFQGKIMEEIEKYQVLVKEVEEQAEAWLKKRNDLVAAHEAEIRRIRQEQDTILNATRTRRLILQEKVATERRNWEETRRQAEEDVDEESENLHSQYHGRIETERQSAMKFKSENGILKKRHTALLNMYEEGKDELERQNDAITQLRSTIDALEREVVMFKSVIHEKDLAIVEKEARISELKVKNGELEKFKFVLDYKIKELKRQVEPREQEIVALRRQTKEVNKNLEAYHTTNLELDSRIGEYRKELDTFREKVKESRILLQQKELKLRKFESDLYTYVQSAKSNPDFVAAAEKLAIEYTPEAPSNSVDGLEMVTESYRQKFHLAQEVNVLRKEARNLAKQHRERVSALVAENTVLIDQIKSLRTAVQKLKGTFREMKVRGLYTTNRKETKSVVSHASAAHNCQTFGRYSTVLGATTNGPTSTQALLGATNTLFDVNSALASLEESVRSMSGTNSLWDSSLSPSDMGSTSIRGHNFPAGSALKAAASKHSPSDSSISP